MDSEDTSCRNTGVTGNNKIGASRRCQQIKHGYRLAERKAWPPGVAVCGLRFKRGVADS
jgi:hypothetical protein